jgi:hypothetical protein
MKKSAVSVLFLFLMGMFLNARAGLLFSDDFNYPDGLVETDGFWYVYSPSSPRMDAFVTNHLLILNETNYDAVAAPSNNFAASDPVYASFTINVSQLPTAKGGYFCQFKDATNDYVCRVFIAATNTVVPGTYRLGIANASPYTSDAAFFPLDLATDITYQVVFSYSVDDALAYLWVNPASSSDTSVYGSDFVTNTAQLGISISQIAFSQYTGQGVVAIGNVKVGTTYDDVTNAPWKPVIGIQPQSTNIYSHNDITLYTVASGTGPLTYQWLNGSTVLGSTSNILALSDLTSTAGYSVIISDEAGSVTSQVAMVTVDTTPTPPFFISEPQSQTNTLFSSVSLTALADGTGPLSYQWFFEPTNGSSFSAVGNGPTLALNNLQYANSGLYYVEVTGGDGTTNSATNTLVVTPPINVTIGYLHSLMQTNQTGNYSLALGAYVQVQGVVTTFGPVSANTATYGEFYIQDGTNGAFVYVGNQGSNGVPPVGSWVNVSGPCSVYGGQLEIDPDLANTSIPNSIAVLSNNVPLPPTQLLNFPLMATNPVGAYGIGIQCSLVTVTNAYLYSSTAGAPVSGTFYTNGYTKLYMTMGPYNSVSNKNYITVFVPAYGGMATNLWNQPIPGHAYQLNGVAAIYYGAPELDVTRVEDFVSNTPSLFQVSVAKSDGVPTLNWPVSPGSTYSVYSATNLHGPWTQTFGLSYYPTNGNYVDTNAAPMKFYRVSTP